jgi:putative transposase
MQGGIYLITHGLVQPNVLSLNQRDEIVDALQHGRGAGWLRLHAFVVMPNHCHALISPMEKHPFEAVLQLFFRQASYPSRRRAEPLLWGPRPRHRILRNSEAVSEVARHIEANPLRRGWIKRPEDWPWSSAHPDFASRLDRDWLATMSQGL